MAVHSILHINTNVVKTTFLYSLPIYVLYHSIKKLKESIDEYNTKANYHKKHNCVVMYSKGEGMSGWPPYTGRIKLTINTFEKYYEPITYFIDTAQKSLDIAVMNINVQNIFNSIQAALSRGVKVRLILDYHYMKREKNMKNLEELGARIMYYVHYDINTLMHYKFAIKDIDYNSGYCLCGSLNWTVPSFFENYEDLVITSNHRTVKSFKKHFETSWNYIKELNEFADTMEIIENENL